MLLRRYYVFPMLLLLIISENNNKYQNWNYPLKIDIPNYNRSIEIRIDNIEKVRRKKRVEVRKNIDQSNNTNTNRSNK